LSSNLRISRRRLGIDDFLGLFDPFFPPLCARPPCRTGELQLTRNVALLSALSDSPFDYRPKDKNSELESLLCSPPFLCVPELPGLACQPDDGRKCTVLPSLIILGRSLQQSSSVGRSARHSFHDFPLPPTRAIVAFRISLLLEAGLYLFRGQSSLFVINLVWCDAFYEPSSSSPSSLHARFESFRVAARRKAPFRRVEVRSSSTARSFIASASGRPLSIRVPSKVNFPFFHRSTRLCDDIGGYESD